MVKLKIKLPLGGTQKKSGDASEKNNDPGSSGEAANASTPPQATVPKLVIKSIVGKVERPQPNNTTTPTAVTKVEAMDVDVKERTTAVPSVSNASDLTLTQTKRKTTRSGEFPEHARVSDFRLASFAQVRKRKSYLLEKTSKQFLTFLLLFPFFFRSRQML